MATIIVNMLKFNPGYSDKRHFDMCRRCHVMDVVHYPIPVAEQKAEK